MTKLAAWQRTPYSLLQAVTLHIHGFDLKGDVEEYCQVLGPRKSLEVRCYTNQTGGKSTAVNPLAKMFLC
jgi:hypothetical protein